MNYSYPFQGMPMMNTPSFGGPGKFALAPALYVGDLDENIQEEVLYDFFSRFGPIHFVRIMRDSATGKSRGYAFVNFIHPRDAESAKQYAQYEKLGRKHIRIMFKRNVRELPPEANIYVKNIDPTANVKDLYNHFSTIGPILCCKIATDHEGKSLGYGYVQYEKSEDAQTAMQTLQGSRLKETELQLFEFVPKDKRTSNTSRRNIYIKNLPTNKNQEEVEKLVTDMFSKYGEIEMKLVKKHPTENKYSAFICYKDDADAQKAFTDLSSNPPTLPGSDERLYVNWYQGKAERQRDLRGKFSQAQNETNLYLKNLAEHVTEQDVKKAFAQFGNVTSVAVRDWKSTNGEKKARYGFVAFDNREDAKRAQMEGLKNNDVRALYLQNAAPYINLHQPRDKRNEYLNSLRRRKMQTGFMDMFSQPRMPFVPNRRFPQPYPPMFNAMKSQMPRMGGGPRNVGGNKPFGGKDRNTFQQKYPTKPQGNTFKNQLKKDEKPTQHPAQTTTAQPEKSEATVTVQSLKNKLSEFLQLEQDKQRQILGELLFPLVKNVSGEALAPKITGMLIDLSVLEVSEILEFLDDPQLLKERVEEAMELIQGEGQ